MKDNNNKSVKRALTRAALVRATHELVLARGHEKISIQDITTAANVGLGTFYNYFDSKQGAFEAVLDQIRGQFYATLHGLRSPLRDPATRLAVTLQFYFTQIQDNQAWNDFVRFAGPEDPYLLSSDSDPLLADIQLGAGGRFKVDDPVLTHNLILGLVRHVSQEIRRGQLSRKAMTETTRHILRMLGLPDQAAKALTQSSWPLPPVAVTRRIEPDSAKMRA